MQFPKRLKKLVKRIRREMKPTPHRLFIDDNARTSYANLKNREIGLAKRQVGEVSWVYRHEIMHLDEYPRTIARELYWSAKIANSLKGYARRFFTENRSLIMNIVEDALIDYLVGRRFRDARAKMKSYIKKYSIHKMIDPPPHEIARMLAAGVMDKHRIKDLIDRGDVLELGVEATYWLLRNRNFEMLLDVFGEASAEDFESAAEELVEEGEDLSPLEEFAEEEGVEVNWDKIALSNLVKSYEWYLSVDKTRKAVKKAGLRQEIWNPGDDIQKLDINSSLSAMPKIIPGITTVKREVREEGYTLPVGFKSVAMLVDESGSMEKVEKAVRKAGLSILGFLNRHRIPFQIICFGRRAYERVPYGTEYMKGAWYFLARYRGWQDDTRFTPALKMIAGRDVLVYVLTDAYIHDFKEVGKYSKRLREVVLVLINRQAGQAREFAFNLGDVPVRAYQVNPDKIENFIVEELGRIR